MFKLGHFLKPAFPVIIQDIFTVSSGSKRCRLSIVNGLCTAAAWIKGHCHVLWGGGLKESPQKKENTQASALLSS